MSSWEWQANDWARWAPFVIPGAYLGRHRFTDVFERDGLQVTFAGWRYSLEEYARALTVRPGYERWQRLPNFLHVRAIKAT